MLKVMISLEVLVEVSHAHGEVLARELIHHLGSNSFAGVLARTPFRTDSSNKALRQVGQDRFQPGVLVHSRERPGCHLLSIQLSSHIPSCVRNSVDHLQSPLQPGLKFLEDNARLLPAGDVGPAIFEKHPPLLDKVGNFGPLNLCITVSIVVNDKQYQHIHFEILLFLIRIWNHCLELQFIHRLLALIYL